METLTTTTNNSTTSTISTTSNPSITSTTSTSSTTSNIEIPTTKSNLKKRKLTSFNSDSNNNNEPDRKKRKFNDMNEHDNNHATVSTTTLLESTQQLQKQNNELQQENSKLTIERDRDKQTFNSCKLEADNWKSKYMQLYSQLTVLTNEEMPSTSTSTSDTTIATGSLTNITDSILKIETNNNLEFDDYSETKSIKINGHDNHNHTNNGAVKTEATNGKYNGIRDRLLEMGFDKLRVINGLLKYSNESAELVFNELIDTFTPGGLQLSPARLLRSHTKRRSRCMSMDDNHNKKINLHVPKPIVFDEINDENDGTEDQIDFENSYYISVNCHICEGHFDDIHEYKIHLEKHYNNTENMIWKHCDFKECNNTTTTPSKFVGHIATHTNDGPYMCSVITNGIKCNKSSGYKSELKTHWKKCHLKMLIQRAKNNNNLSDSDAISDAITASHSHSGSDNGNINGNESDASEMDVDSITEKQSHEYQLQQEQQQVTVNLKHSHSHSHKKRSKRRHSRSSKKRQHNSHKSSSKSNKNVKTNGYKRTRNMNVIETTNNNEEFTEFADSYHVSINCHICNKHFNDFDTYKSHLQKEYDSADGKIWRKCDLGCIIDPQKPLFNDNLVFISHIAQHTKDKPFVCDVVINGIKCQSTFGERKNLRGHWKTHFNNCLKRSKRSNRAIRTTKVKSESIESNSSELNGNNSKKSKRKLKSRKKLKAKKAKIKIKMKKKIIIENEIDFENSYHVSINCHVCNKHFENYEKYEMHVQKHYETDVNKIWRKCDFGCKTNPEKPLFINNYLFISHIANHTKKKPFKCDVITNGIKCQSSCGSKNNMKLHWKKHLESTIKNNSNKKNSNHSNKFKKNKIKHNSPQKSKPKSKPKPKRKVKKCQPTTHDVMDADFEDCYYISVNCHICDFHFNDLYDYREHIKDHYETDHLRTWLKCDMGCKNRKDSSTAAFTYHIATHTKDFPFKCAVMINGKECPRTSGQKSDMKRHWQSTHLKMKNVRKKGGGRKRNNKYEKEMDYLGESSDEESEYESSSYESETESVINDIGFNHFDGIKIENNNEMKVNKVYEYSDGLSENDISSSSYYSSTTSEDEHNF